MCVIVADRQFNGSDHEEKQPLNCTQSDLYGVLDPSRPVVVRARC